MKSRNVGVFVGALFGLALLSSQANAHWCDDLWASSYNIVVRPDTDTSPKNVYVQNNMGYQLTNFKLTAGGGVTLTAPTLKVPGTLMPGEKGTWKISGGSPAKIEDITFSVSFGNSGQSRCYPLTGGSPVMVVKTDKTLVPAKATGLESPATVCAESSQARDLQFQGIAEFEDVNLGLDKLLNFYCSGRGSWGASDGVTPTYCKDASSTTCPTTKPSGGGTKYNYIHLWAAGELAARKASLGARTAVFRARLQCGVNDGNVGFAGFALLMLGYLGEDATARTFIESQISSGTSDMAGIAKAALLLMGKADDMTKYKADVTTGLKSSSTFVAVASAAALGIVAKDDAAITGTLIPLVKWVEPDTSDDGKGMFAAHVLALVAWDRRGWVGNGGDTGPVSFYGDTATAGAGGGSGTGTGGAVGSGGVTGAGGVAGSGGGSGSKDASPNDAKQGTGGSVGGATGKGGVSGASGTTGGGSAPGAGGTVVGPGGSGAGGVVGSGGSKPPSSASTGGNSGGGTPAGNGGDPQGGTDATGGSSGTAPVEPADSSSGCKCNLGGPGQPSTLSLFALVGLALAAARRRRR